MGLSNSKLKIILDTYKPDNFFKIKSYNSISKENIIYLQKNDKLYILFFEDYLIITDKYGTEKFNISYYKITSWKYNIKEHSLYIILSENYSNKILIKKIKLYCYNNNINKILDCLSNKTFDLLEYTRSLLL